MSSSAQSAALAERETLRSRPSTATTREAVSVFFSYPTPRLILALLLLTTGARASAGAFEPWDLLIVLAVAVLWPMQEWFLHRFVLHIRPFTWRGRTIDLEFARRHRQHHENPSNFDLVFLPLYVPILAYAVFFGLLTLVLPTWSLRWTAMAAVTAASLLYEWVHFMSHCDHRPKTRWMREIWRNHRLHHYRNELHWFSFTVPRIDQWMGTGGSPSSVPASPTVRSLGVDDPTHVSDAGLDGEIRHHQAVSGNVQQEA